MSELLLEREQLVPCGKEEAFEFFSDAYNLQLITPPFLRFKILDVRPAQRLGLQLAHLVHFPDINRLDNARRAGISRCGKQGLNLGGVDGHTLDLRASAGTMRDATLAG